MNLNIYLKISLSALLLSCMCSASASRPVPITREEHVAVQPMRYPLPLSAVRITGGLLLHAQEMNRRWLSSMEPDRYLSGFRSEAGLETKIPRYGGWENSGCSGHGFGHYLSAMAMSYAATGDVNLLDKLNYSINALVECQEKEGSGLLAGFERSRPLFEELRGGDIRSQGFDLNGGWVPFYTLHKLFAGLVDVCRHTPNQQAMGVMVQLTDWLDELCKGLSDEQMNQILICEHGGITEALADVFALTGQQKYLDLARRFDHHDVLRSLIAAQDSLPGKHANTHIPKIVGAVREYECSGEKSYYELSNYFWRRVVNHHSYAIGGNSEYEHFGAPDMLSNRLSDGTCETCNTYNMLKLTRHLYQLAPSTSYADYYERALYNQILASQNPDDGMVCYMSPMGSGHRKHFSSPFDSFWCCVGSGMENHARYGEFIYFTDKNENLYVNLFIPSTLDWASRGVKLIQSTEFPYSDQIGFNIEMAKGQRFSLNLRYPQWATDGYLLTVNGKPVKSQSKPGDYIVIDRKWHSGDRVDFTLRQSLRSEQILGDSTQRAYLYGPIVLSAPLADGEKISVLVSDNITDAASLVKCVDKNKLRFETLSAQPEQRELIPYFEIGGRRMMLYFRHFPSATWCDQLADMRLSDDREAWIRERTVSQFSLGEMQPERDHNLRGERTTPHEFEGKKYRESLGGWFSFDMAVSPDHPNTLYCTYWGNRLYNHSFDIEVDGGKIGFENIHNWGSQYVERNYQIPLSLTQGKQIVSITLRAIRDDAVAGPLFDCRIMK